MNKWLGDVVIRLVEDKVEEVAVSTLEGEGKVVAVYFSAHWCPPCRAFTPQLAKWYRKFKDGPNGDKFEIVFASSDRDDQSFMDYFKDMPWLALPFAERKKKNDLSRKFKVSGIPTLAMVNAANGKLITSDGRSVIVEDDSGKGFPWIPGPFLEVIKGKFCKGIKGREVDTEHLRGKTLGVYFSAYWCGPCRSFTPQLATIYKKLRSRGIKFEIIYVSSDKDERQWKDYYSTMPWICVPYGDPRKKTLSRMFDVQGIPTLVMIDAHGQVINMGARSAVGMDLKGERYPWYPEPVRQLTGLTGADINDFVSLVWFKYDRKGSELADVMRPVANEWIQKWKDAGEEELLIFYVTGSDIDDEDDIAISLTSFAALKKDTQLAIVDINNQKVYECDATDVNAGVIGVFVEGFLNQSIEGKPLKS